MNECGGSGGCGGNTLVIETKELKVGNRDDEIHEFMDKERPIQFKWTMGKLRQLEKLLWFLKGLVNEGGWFITQILPVLDSLLHHIDISMEYPPQIPDVEELTSERDSYQENYRRATARLGDLEERMEESVARYHKVIEGLQDRVKELQEAHDTHLLWIEEHEELVAKVSDTLLACGIPDKVPRKGTPAIPWVGEVQYQELSLSDRVGMLAAKVVELKNKMKPKRPD